MWNAVVESCHCSSLYLFVCFQDPLITCHWATLSSPTRTSVKVSIVSAGYDTILRTQFVIHVGEKQLTVVCKDGKVLKFSHEPQELRDFILCQISHHQVGKRKLNTKYSCWGRKGVFSFPTKLRFFVDFVEAELNLSDIKCLLVNLMYFTWGSFIIFFF